MLQFAYVAFTLFSRVDRKVIIKRMRERQESNSKHRQFLHLTDHGFGYAGFERLQIFSKQGKYASRKVLASRVAGKTEFLQWEPTTLQQAAEHQEGNIVLLSPGKAGPICCLIFRSGENHWEAFTASGDGSYPPSHSILVESSQQSSRAADT
eukprot:1160501-Pelagomonas_calceolata.AAC.7